MNHSFLKNSRLHSIGKFLLTTSAFLLSLNALIPVNPAAAQTVLFDFDNAPLYSSFPISQTAGGITAYFTATGQGYSIQEANVLGFVPQGFAGRIIYPNSVFLADLLISFDQTITHFSIMYSCQELGCDDAATMRVTAYMNGSYVGTNTKTASVPGTWPVDTLSCTFSQGFDSVVIHYDSPPPTCQDYGVIYMADNMKVVPMTTTGFADEGKAITGVVIPNPVNQSAIISFSLLHSENITVAVYDLTGRCIANLFSGNLSAGVHQMSWDVRDPSVKSGMYFLTISGEGFSAFKIEVLK